jgi:hypothetical protein
MKGESELIPKAESVTSASEELSKAIDDEDLLAIECSALKILLFSDPASALNFAWVMQIILDHDRMSPGWKSAFNHAYERQPPGRRILYRDSMTKMYLWFKDYHMAVKFLASKPELPGELSDSMEVYIHLKRYDDARSIAEICGQRMVSCRDADSMRSLVRTLKRYHRAVEHQENERYELRELISSLETQWMSRTERHTQESKERTDNEAMTANTRTIEN